MAMYYLVEQNGEHFYVDAGGRRVPDEKLKGGFTLVNHDADLSSSKVITITQSGKFGYQTLDGQPLVDCVLDYDIKTAQGFVDAMSSLKAKYIKLIQQHPENKAQLRQGLEQEVRNLLEARRRIVVYQQKLESEATAEKETASTPSNTTETVSPAETNNATTTTTKPVSTTESSSPTKTPLGNGIIMLIDAQGHYGYEDKDGSIFIPCDLPIDVSAPSKTYNASITKLFEECKVKLNSCTPSEKQALINEYKRLSERIQTARQAYNSKVKELKTLNSASTATAETTEPSTTKTSNQEEIKQEADVVDLSKARLIKEFDKINFYYIDDDKKYVVTDKENHQLHVFDKLAYFTNGYAKVMIKDQDRKYGYMRQDGTLLGEGCIYDNITLMNTEGYAVAKCCKKQDDGTTKWGILTNDGYVGGECLFDSVKDQFKEGFAVVQLNGKCGYIKEDGTFLGDGCTYDEAKSFKNGMAIVQQGKRKGFINAEGKLVTDGYPFDVAWNFDENGIAIAGVDNKVGLINENCNYLGEGCVFTSIAALGHGLFEAKKDVKYGIIDSTGTLITDGYVSDDVIAHGDILMPIKSGNRYAYVNLKGKQVTEFIYTSFSVTTMTDHFLEDMRLVPVCIDGKWGFIDENGQTILECCLAKPGDYNKEDLLQRCQKLNENKSNLDNASKDDTTEAKTAEPSSINTNKVAKTKASTSETNGTKASTNNDGDSTAEYVTIVRYDHINHILTVMDKAGKTKSYFSSHFFKKEQVYIVDDGLDVLAEGVISKDGKIVVPCIKGTDIKPFNDGFAIIRRNGKYGYINSKGDEILKCIYDTIEFFGSSEANLMCVKLNGKWGVIDTNGKEIVKCTLTLEEADEAIAKLKDGTFNPEDYKQETVGANSKRNTGITGDDKSLTDVDEGVTSDGEDTTDCDDGVTGDGGITV